MSTIIPQPAGSSPFDAIREVDALGNDFWSARRLQPLVAYRRWEDFKRIVERAKRSAENSGHDADQGFSVVTENLGGTKPREDYRLTRFAAYLVAMNGDPNKPEVALAQAYFAAQTRKAELAETSSPNSDLDAIDSIVKALRADRQRITALEQRQAETAAKLEAIEGQHDWFTALGFAKLHGLPTSRTYLMKVGKAATAIMRKNGQVPERRQDATFGTVNVYPSAVLEQAFAEVAS